MGYDSRNENNIVDTGKSRFSAEERARMAEERTLSPGRKASVREDNRKKLQTRQKARKEIKPEEGKSRNENIKKSASQRKKVSKRENGLVFTLIILVLIAGISVFCMTVFFKTQEIKLNNGGLYSDETVLSSSGIETGDNLVLTDSKKVKHKIEYELPYIENAAIKKHWPDRIEITLTYAVPELAADTGTGYVLMTAGGKVLETSAPSVPDTAALVKGAVVEKAEPGKEIILKNENGIKDLVSLISALEENGITGVRAYDIYSDSDVKVSIDYRIELLLGSFYNAEEKLTFGSEVIKKTLESGSDGFFVIDIRDGKKAYVRSTGDNSINRNAAASEEETTEEAGSEETVIPGNLG